MTSSKSAARNSRYPLGNTDALKTFILVECPFTEPHHTVREGDTLQTLTMPNVVEAEPATEQEQPKQTLPQTESAQYSHEDYAKCVEAQEKEAQEIKEKRTRAVLDYVHRTMSRFLYEEDLYKVIEAVKEWSNDTNYTPTAINRFKENVENIPLRHFVWNIAERLGKRDYTMAMRISFIKAMFPKPFEGLDYSTLKNLKAPCSNDIIPIDEPANGGYDFHDVTEENPE